MYRHYEATELQRQMKLIYTSMTSSSQTEADIYLSESVVSSLIPALHKSLDSPLHSSENCRLNFQNKSK